MSTYNTVWNLEVMFGDTVGAHDTMFTFNMVPITFVTVDFVRQFLDLLIDVIDSEFMTKLLRFKQLQFNFLFHYNYRFDGS